MIPRYKVQEIHDIWKSENKLNTWLKVELSHLESLLANKENKTITQEELDIIKKNVKVDKDRWKEIESITNHDLQAFVQMLEESIPDNSGRWIHYGLTSSDIIDTSLVLLCKQSLKVVVDYCAIATYHINNLIKSKRSKNQILSRTHGKVAEVQTYCDVFRRWEHLIRRAFDDIIMTSSKLNFGKLSGPSGNNTINSKANEAYALSQLGLIPTVSSQIISRDMFLDYFYSMLKLVLAAEKIAYDIRIYSIDGINEMSEPFRDGQKGSSSMPHKKNPILTENICGLTRLYKSYFQTAIDNCLTLLERDISNSSSERIIFKDAAHICCHVIYKLSIVLEGLNIHEEKAQENIDINLEKVNSQEKLNKLISEGKSRKDSHDLSS
jgi:adenylosuccinate lyase